MNQRSNFLRPSAFILLTLLLSLSPVRAGFVETFDNGSNNGDWHLTVNPATIQPDGGNPGAYLRASADAAVPTWYVPYLTKSTYSSATTPGNRSAPSRSTSISLAASRFPTAPSRSISIPR